MKKGTNTRAYLRRIAATAALLTALAATASAQRISYNCTNCGELVLIVTETIEAEGSYIIGYGGVCTSYLDVTLVCGFCSELITLDIVDPIPHSWGDGTHIADATCTTAGYDEHTCTRCNWTERYNEKPSLGHDWGTTFGDYVAPTCTTAGGYNHTCKRCNLTELDNSGGAALGHDWGDWTHIADATCTTAAVEARHCQRNGCVASETRNVGDPLGHDWGADYRCIRGDAELPAIAYVKADGTEGSHQAIPITGDDSDDVALGFENADTWYYLSGESNLKSLRLIDRTANIILTKDANIFISNGTTVANGSLNIYTQSETISFASSFNVHGDVNFHGGAIYTYTFSAGGNITLGWTNITDSFCARNISVGGTITVAAGKALKKAGSQSEIFYGDGTAIEASDIAGMISLIPKTDALCYFGADDRAHFLNDGDYTVLTNETELNPESSSAEAVQWLVVRGNVEFTGDLSLCGTTHLILLDDAVLTASSGTTYALYTERATNIYGSTKGNGRIEVTNGGNFYAAGLLNIYGGDIRINGCFNGRGTKNLSWTREANRFTAASYDGSAPRIVEGKAFTDADEHFYKGTLDATQTAALDGVTLIPITYRPLRLGDNDNNTSAITTAAGFSAEGDEYAVTLLGRTIYKDGEWNTLCLPFAMTSAQIAASPLAGSYLMELDGSKSNLTDGTLTLSFTKATSIEAGKPYILKWETTGMHLVNPLFQGVTITSTTPAPATSSDRTVTFVGQYDPIEVTEPYRYIMLGSNNTMGYAATGNTLRPFRAHFEIASDQSVKACNISFGEGAETSIQNSIFINSKFKVTDDAWYSIDGRKLPGKPTKKGIYIHNGNKVAL